MDQQEICVKSSLDGTMQPSLFFRSGSAEKRPLLVGLHAWSYNRFNQIQNMLPIAEKYDFNLLMQEFRGSNLSTNYAPHVLACCENTGEMVKRSPIHYLDTIAASNLKIFH